MSLNQSFISDFSEYYRRSQRTKMKYKPLIAMKKYKIIHKKEGGSYYVVSANKASSVTL